MTPKVGKSRSKKIVRYASLQSNLTLILYFLFKDFVCVENYNQLGCRSMQFNNNYLVATLVKSQFICAKNRIFLRHLLDCFCPHIENGDKVGQLWYR
jgi:hypothetical protein